MNNIYYFLFFFFPFYKVLRSDCIYIELHYISCEKNRTFLGKKKKLGAKNKKLLRRIAFASEKIMCEYKHREQKAKYKKKKRRKKNTQQFQNLFITLD